MLQERFNSRTRAEINAARIEIARARLDRAEQIMILRRSEFATLPCDSLDRENLLQVLKLSERAVFNRRLELDLLLRARRRQESDQKP
ncbi:MAG: hypothetical protein QM699_14635 [Amaricoccus sp.]|uniref:hypothetical protein n=1 Tax=Amaricoccus sp. TaxID=1872485 RepID=UPI0039E3412F